MYVYAEWKYTAYSIQMHAQTWLFYDSNLILPVFSCVQVSHPKNMEPRYSHTAAIFGSGHNCRMVVMYGGRRKVGGPTIAETTLFHLGEWMG